MLLDHFEQDREEILTALLEKVTGLEFFNSDFDRFSAWIAPLKQQFHNKKIKVLTIAGSNGKGQVAFTLAHYCKVNGKRFCMWTSPHINSVRERFISHEGMISYELLTKELSEFANNGYSDYNPSYYELLFALFLKWCIGQELDYIILEVGLGGRLDAVNILDTDIAVVTSISREHADILGHRYDQILMEKLGVARSNKLLFTHFSTQYLRERTATFATQRSIHWRDLYEMAQLSGVKNYLESNLFLAQEVAKSEGWELLIHPKSIGSGRFEVLSTQRCSFTLVGAHNLDGVRALKGVIQTSFDLALVAFSKRPVKEIEQMCKILSKIEGIKRIIITYYHHPKAADSNLVQEVATQLGITFIEDWKSYLEHNMEGRVLVSGSYYFIGQLKREFYL